jgi:hypothetical protein
LPPSGQGWLAGLALALLAGPALAQSDQAQSVQAQSVQAQSDQPPTNQVHGRLELQDAEQFTGPNSVQAQLGEQTANDVLGNLRLTWEPTWGQWSFQVHYVLAAEDGPNVTLARAEAGLISQPPATLFDLTDTFLNRGPWIASQGIDRLAVTYATPDLVVRVGRQALTWGSGLVFRPMDLFDPFGPTATDTEYKPGVDMLYLQQLFADG